MRKHVWNRAVLSNSVNSGGTILPAKQGTRAEKAQHDKHY